MPRLVMDATKNKSANPICPEDYPGGFNWIILYSTLPDSQLVYVAALHSLDDAMEFLFRRYEEFIPCGTYTVVELRD